MFEAFCSDEAQPVSIGLSRDTFCCCVPRVLDARVSDLCQAPRTVRLISIVGAAFRTLFFILSLSIANEGMRSLDECSGARLVSYPMIVPKTFNCTRPILITKDSPETRACSLESFGAHVLHQYADVVLKKRFLVMRNRDLVWVLRLSLADSKLSRSSQCIITHWWELNAETKLGQPQLSVTSGPEAVSSVRIT